MAEERNVWQDFLAGRHHDITRAFRELHDRWSGIFDQEEARWSQAGQEWQLARGQEGQLRWDGYPKTFEETVKDYQQALHDMRHATDMRLPWEAYSGYGSSMSGPHPELQTHDWMPERGTVAYVEWVVRGAIRTGYEEGYPLRADQIENIRQAVWAQEIGQHELGATLEMASPRELERAVQEERLDADAYTETRAALHEVLGEIYTQLQEHHPNSAEAMDLRAEAADIQARLAQLGRDPGPPLVADDAREYVTQYTGMLGSTPGRMEIDTSDSDMGTSWQQTLQQLQARLDALAQEVSPQEKAQEYTHDAGMGY